MDFSGKPIFSWPQWRPTKIKERHRAREQGDNINIYVMSRKELMDNETNISGTH